MKDKIVICLLIFINVQIGKSQDANIDFLFMQFSGCEGNREQELIGLYSLCGFYVDDLTIRLDPDFSADNTGIDGNINDGGFCGWTQGDTNKFIGCQNLHVAKPGDFIPANALVVIQMTFDAGFVHSLERQCETGLPIYILRNSCERTEEAFPILRTENYQLQMQLTGKNPVIYDAKFRDDPSLWGLPLIQFNRLGQRSGSNCGDLLIYNTWDHLIQPILSIDELEIGQPDCSNDKGILNIHSSGPVGYYSVDGGLSWRMDSLFMDLDTGFYNIVIRDTSNPCIISYPNPVGITPYSEPSFVTTWWSLLPDTFCQGALAEIYSDWQTDPGPLDPKLYEYSIDSGFTWQDSWKFTGLVDGTYNLAIRPKASPQCVTHHSWDSPPLPEVPKVWGISPDTVGFCSDGRVEIQATGNNLLYSLDGIAYHRDSNVVLIPNTTYTLYVKEEGNERCTDSVDVILRQAPEFVPEVTINGNSASFSLSIASKGPYTLLWSNGDTTAAVQNLPLGFNYLDITDGWGCNQRYAFFIEDNSCVFQLTDSIVDATCETPMTSIYLKSNDTINTYTYDWSLDDFDGLPHIENVPHGTYIVEVSYGICNKKIEFTTPIGGIEQVEISTKTAGCTGIGNIIIEAITGGQGPFTVDLTGEQFDSSLTIMGVSSGIHPLLITDVKGCEYRDTIEVDANASLAMATPELQVDCESSIYTLNLARITGGHAPYQLIWEGNILSGFVVENLPPGHYRYQIVDSAGCHTGIDEIDLVEIPSSNLLDRDTIIEPGDPIHLHAAIDTSGLFNYGWSSEFGKICNYCIDTIYNHALEGDYFFTYNFKIGDSAGCPGTHRFNVKYLQEKIYIPNAFSPNGDNANDAFEIYAPNYEVLTMQIYNRWGDKVYSTQGPNFQWNGQIGNTKAEQGVYIYHVILKEANGRTQQETGSITLIR